MTPIPDSLIQIPEGIPSVSLVDCTFQYQIVKGTRWRYGNGWVVRDGFAVTSPLRTLVDLEAVGTDGGHLENYVSDALRSGTIQRVEVDALNLSQSTDALLAMDDKTGP
jgi:hypothetical protein